MKNDNYNILKRGFQNLTFIFQLFLYVIKEKNK